MKVDSGCARSLSLVGLCLVCTAWPALAQDGQATARVPTRGELLEQLIPVYREVQANVEIQGLIRQLRSGPTGEETQDRLLRRLPLSPLEMLRVDMRLRRYEVAIPYEVNRLHERWVRLNPELARKYYGDDYVDSILGQSAERVADTGGGAAAVKATVGTNRNLAADYSSSPTEYQGEIQVAVNPANPNQVVAASNTMGGCSGDQTQGIFFSSDGGDTWGFTCAPSASAYGMTCSLPLGMIFGSDPALSWDDSNGVHFEYMMICSFLGIINQMAIVVAGSSNGGVSWSGEGVVVNTWGTQEVQDKEFYAVDRYPASPYHGRHYTCWDHGNDEQVAYSTSGGSSWTQVDLPSAPVGGTDIGCELAVQDNGTVHVVFDSLTCETSTCTDERMFYSHSTNGGVSWATPVQVQDFNLVSFSSGNTPAAQDSRGINPFGAVDVDNSGGACDGYLYATFTDYTVGSAENCDVWVRRSTDQGATWGAPVRVNDDGAGGAIQFHPFLVVDQSNGHVVVAWHDARNDGSNQAVDYYLARSVDCGASFEANVQASQPSGEFNNPAITYTNENTSANANANANQYGEYMGLDVLNGTAYLAWADSRHFFPGSTTEPQKENVGFVKVTFVTPETPLFADDFESGDTTHWSSAQP